MAKDKIFLIAPGFEDPKHPGKLFVCPYCNQVEGLLAAFPALAAKVEIERVPFLRPRQTVIAAIGEENQGLPVLVYGDNAPADASRAGNGQAFTSDTKAILAALAERHGFPYLHG
jgi:hypothetical protein